MVGDDAWRPVAVVPRAGVGVGVPVTAGVAVGVPAVCGFAAVCGRKMRSFILLPSFLVMYILRVFIGKGNNKNNFGIVYGKTPLFRSVKYPSGEFRAVLRRFRVMQGVTVVLQGGFVRRG